MAFGGTFLLAFPQVMATAFAGFYLALWFVLWSFILRGMSIEVGGHIHDPLWQSWWDFVFAVSSVVLAVLFGAALGNVIRGVPLDESGKFSMSLFTDFGVRGRVGHPRLVHGVGRGVHDHAALGARRDLPPAQDHWSGARAQRTSRAPAMDGRARAVSRHLAGNLDRPAGAVRGDDGAAARLACDRGRAWLEPGRSFTGLRGTAEGRAFAGSCAVIAGLLAGAAASVFPVMLLLDARVPSTR